mmetsp:Transcript_7003/g.8074  ORF Transcript_7003/g.8074 Transcript_7003/m.8074 type:complete len:144 (-) Transcript_7003:93-524(-)
MHLFLLVGASTGFCTVYNTLHFGSFFGKSFVKNLEAFRSKSFEEMMESDYSMNLCFQTSTVANLLLSTATGILFQQYQPQSMPEVISFAGLLTVIIGCQAHHDVWEGKPVKLIALGLLSQAVCTFGSCLIFHAGDLVHEPRLF